MNFNINKKLEESTYKIKETEEYLLLLSKNSLVTWLILVPKTSEVELFKCSDNFKTKILKSIDLYANKLNDELTPDKVNIASIGNVVSQLHIHIVARFKSDFAWPDPIWGKSDFKKYNEIELKKAIELFK